MATIKNEIALAVPAAKVWDAVRDFGNLHTRLVKGFVTGAKAERDAAGNEVRSITFANGMEARETLVARDDAARRLVYCIIGGRATHYNASVEVREAGAGASLLVWTIDLLPDELAGPVGAMAAKGAEAIKKTLEG